LAAQFVQRTATLPRKKKHLNYKYVFQRFSGLPAVKYSPFSARHLRVYRTSSVLFCLLNQLSLTPAGNGGNLYGFLSTHFISSQRSPSSKTKQPTKIKITQGLLSLYTTHPAVKIEYVVNVENCYT